MTTCDRSHSAESGHHGCKVNTRDRCDQRSAPARRERSSESDNSKKRPGRSAGSDNSKKRLALSPCSDNSKMRSRSRQDRRSCGICPAFRRQIPHKDPNPARTLITARCAWAAKDRGDFAPVWTPRFRRQSPHDKSIALITARSGAAATPAERWLVMTGK
jgi:hypothetical protein